jgi:hypothetical protein
VLIIGTVLINGTLCADIAWEELRLASSIEFLELEFLELEFLELLAAMEGGGTIKIRHSLSTTCISCNMYVYIHAHSLSRTASSSAAQF